MTRRSWLALAGILALAAAPAARSVFTDVFPPEEFAARRARVMDQIGNGVTILQGSPEPPAEAPFRQNNQFFYLTGVEAPRALLVIDGRARRVTLSLADNARRARAMGPVLQPGPEAARVTGVDAALPREHFGDALAAILHDGRTIYTPFRPEVRRSGSAGDAAASARATREDPWDGRPSREEAFVATIKARSPDAGVRDLDPILDDLRFLKSPREIALIREATAITGEAIVEVMREARPGLFEYELQAVAEYVFKKRGAQGAAYFALIATGQNTIYSHYHANTVRLADGDLVQFDYAPDYKYYVSDVTRVFPASGRFTLRPRERWAVSWPAAASPTRRSAPRPRRSSRATSGWRKDPPTSLGASATPSAWRSTASAARCPRSSPARSSRSSPRCGSRRTRSASASRTSCSSPRRVSRTSPRGCRSRSRTSRR